MKLLLTGAFSYTSEQLKQIEAMGADITFVQDEREELSIDVSDFDAVVCNGLFLKNIFSTRRALISAVNTSGLSIKSSRAVDLLMTIRAPVLERDIFRQAITSSIVGNELGSISLDLLNKLENSVRIFQFDLVPNCLKNRRISF